MPNRYDLEFLLYIIYSGHRGSDREEIIGSCGHHSKWAPTEHQLRTGLARLEVHGLIDSRGDRYYADPALGEALRASSPHGGTFEEYAALARLVEERLSVRSHAAANPALERGFLVTSRLVLAGV